jgi:peptide/nickel transport system substrate-binding protein
MVGGKFMKKRLIGLFIAFVLIIVMASGCGGGSSDTVNNDSGDDSKVSESEIRDDVNIVLEADIATLDPQMSASTCDIQVFINIYDTLVDIDDDGNFIGNLSENWDISEDGLSYTFYLRKGVKFHNGEELKASDVVFSFNRGKESPYLEGQLVAIKDVEAIDDYTVKINLNYSYAPLLLALYDQVQILNEKAVTEAGDSYGEHPIGTGAYKFVSHNIGEKVVLERFDDYFKGKAPIKNVVFKVITDENTALIALETGDADFSYKIPMISVPSVMGNKDLATYEIDTVRLNYVLMNTEQAPFDNVKLRQAINYAIDKYTIVQVAEEGMGEVTDSIFSPDIFGYSDIDGYEYNPEKAKELLKEAGYGDGLTLTFKTLDGIYKKAAEIIQENLRNVGITVNIEVEEKNAYIQDLVSGNYEFGNIGVSVGKDADQYSIVFMSGEQANFSKYSDEELDNLFAKGRETIDKTRRLEIYKEVAQKISDEAVIVPLYYPKIICVSRSKLDVGYIDPQEHTKVYYMNWK